MKIQRILPATLAVAFLAGGAAGGQPAAYQDPPWADECAVHQFDEGEAPDPFAYPDDPLCVEYQKRDITVTNGGAVAFLLAEPARFGLAAGRCRYWQQDYWSAQVAPDSLALLTWDGSYWWDFEAGTGGGIMRNFRIAGAPVGVSQAADIVEEIHPGIAEAMRAWGHPGGGGGFSGGFPFGSCPA